MIAVVADSEARYEDALRQFGLDRHKVHWVRPDDMVAIRGMEYDGFVICETARLTTAEMAELRSRVR